MNSSRITGVLVCWMVVATSVLGSSAFAEPETSPAWEWLIETLDIQEGVGYFVSAATDPEVGETFVSFYNGSAGELWLARNQPPGVGNCGPGYTWHCQVLDSDGVVGKYNSIAVGGAGAVAQLYISYHDVTNGSLKVVDGEVDRETGALSYVVEVVEQGDPGAGLFVGTRTAATVNSLGKGFIAYKTEKAAVISEIVNLAIRVDLGTGNCGEGTLENAWQCEPIEGGTAIGDYLDLELIYEHDYPFIMFSNAEHAHTFPVFVWRVGSSGDCNLNPAWRCGAVKNGTDDTGEWLSITVPDSGHVHAAYRNATTSTVEWARHVGSDGNCGYGTWQCDRIDVIGSGVLLSGVDIDIDDENRPLISYQDVEGGYFDLKIARPVEALPWGPDGNCGPLSPSFFPTWFCETLEAGDQYHSEAVGGLSIAVNARGDATIAYRELFDSGVPPAEGRLKVATEPTPDLIPDPFSFTSQTGVLLNTLAVSDWITVHGVDGVVPISISACTGGPCQYAVNGGAWQNDPGDVAEGDTVMVRQVSAPTYQTTTELTLKIGVGYGRLTKGTFSVTTLAQHLLTVAMAGTGSGSVTSIPPGIDCPATTCSALFDETTTVVLTPIPEIGSYFSGWSGDSDCADGVVDMGVDVSCTATFEIDSSLIFANGFESGDSSAWTVTAP